MFYPIFSRLLWDQVITPPKNWGLKARDLKSRDRLIKAAWPAFKREYYPLHTLYRTIQELTLILDLSQTKSQQAKILYQKASEGTLEDKIRYSKAIIASKQFHKWILEEQCFFWMKLLENEIIPNALECIPSLLYSFSIQKEELLNKLSAFEIERILKFSEESQVYFFTSPSLIEWRKLLFSKQQDQWNVLQDLLITLITKSPKLIPEILQDSACQQMILFNQRKGEALYNILLHSEAGPTLLLIDDKFEPLLNLFLSSLRREHSELTGLSEIDTIYCLRLLKNHSKADQFLYHHPEIYAAFPFFELKIFADRYPKTVKLKEYGSNWYLAVASDQTSLPADNVLEAMILSTAKEQLPTFAPRKIEGLEALDESPSISVLHYQDPNITKALSSVRSFK